MDAPYGAFAFKNDVITLLSSFGRIEYIGGTGSVERYLCEGTVEIAEDVFKVRFYEPYSISMAVEKCLGSLRIRLFTRK